jgi:hypothetical protein
MAASSSRKLSTLGSPAGRDANTMRRAISAMTETPVVEANVSAA